MSITGIFAVINVDRLFIMIIDHILFRPEGYACAYSKNIYQICCKKKSAKLLMTYAVGKLEAALNVRHLILSTSSQRVS